MGLKEPPFHTNILHIDKANTVLVFHALKFFHTLKHFVTYQNFSTL